MKKLPIILLTIVFLFTLHIIYKTRVPAYELSQYNGTPSIDIKLKGSGDDIDFSGMTFNPDGNNGKGSLLIVDDKTLHIHEYTNEGNYIRTIKSLGFPPPPESDWEDITYIENERYAVANEHKREMILLSIPNGTENISINASDALFYKIDEGFDNKGLEGIAYHPDTGAIFMGKERNPMKLYKVTVSNLTSYSTNNPPKIAVEDCPFDTDEIDARVHNIRGLTINRYSPKSLYILTAQPNKIFEIDLKTGKIKHELIVNSTNTALRTEGIAFNKNGELCLTGEPKKGKENFLIYRPK